MATYRGMSTLVFIVLVGGLLLLLASVAFDGNFQNVTIPSTSPSERQSTKDVFFDYYNPDATRKALITKERDEKMSEYSLGIYYTLINFVAFSRSLKETGEGYERLCANGKVNRDDPEVKHITDEILCGANVKCDGIPYIFRSYADNRCYATKTAFAISANIYDVNGSLTPTCLDSTEKTSGGVANPNTLRCETGGSILHKAPWEKGY